MKTIVIDPLLRVIRVIRGSSSQFRQGGLGACNGVAKAGVATFLSPQAVKDGGDVDVASPKGRAVLKAAAGVWEEVDAVLGMAITVGRRAEAGAQKVGFLWQIVLAKG